MLKELRPALVLLLSLTVITGLVYPLVMTQVAQTVFPTRANGSLLERDGTVVGSALIGQSFVSERYFHGRPSATTATDPSDISKTISEPYNAVNSGGSNLGPSNAALIERVKTDIEKLRSENAGAKIPADLVTASASGLDPHITPAAALFQVSRVARVRGLSEAQVRDIVQAQVEQPLAGILGEARVNVLALNLALDSTAPR